MGEQVGQFQVVGAHLLDQPFDRTGCKAIHRNRLACCRRVDLFPHYELLLPKYVHKSTTYCSSSSSSPRSTFRPFAPFAISVRLRSCPFRYTSSQLLPRSRPRPTAISPPSGRSPVQRSFKSRSSRPISYARGFSSCRFTMTSDCAPPSRGCSLNRAPSRVPPVKRSMLTRFCTSMFPTPLTTCS